MNWLHWWVPEFIASFVLWIFLAPSLGTYSLKRFNLEIGSALNRSAFEFILGFCLTCFFASFLVALHQLALIVVFGGLVVLRLRGYRSQFKLQWWDLLLLPVMVCVLYYPLVIDSNLTYLQYSVGHDFWPLDWGPRLDAHNSIATLFSYWFKKVPLMNLLAVQAPFFGLVVWRGLILCWQLIKNRRITQLETAMLAVTYAGSLYFRKQIEMKASPIGGFFAILTCILLTQEISPVILGFFVAACLIFGEYGAILIFVIAPLLLINPRLRKTLFASAIWVATFAGPEIVRKLIIFSGFGGPH